MSTERVLVFPESLIAGFKEDAQGSVLTDKSKVMSYLKGIMSGLEFMDRAAAETDPAFKQLIPYAVLIKGRMVFRYQRTKKAGEARLHDNWSVGVGGHINPVDGEATNRTTYWKGFYRELDEEVGAHVDWEKESTPIVGLIYDDSNDVGRVHFGVVHLVRIAHDSKLLFTDDAMSKGEFRHVLDLKQSTDNFENWSRLVIDKVL